jgi:hypothetical protein
MKRKGSPKSSPAPEKKEKKKCGRKEEIAWDKVFEKYPTLDRSFKDRIRNVEWTEGIFWEPESSGNNPDNIDDDEECMREWHGMSFEFERVDRKGRRVWTKLVIRDGDDCVLWKCRYNAEPFGIAFIGDRCMRELLANKRRDDEWKIAANVVWDACV